jgi:hypothetical protein
MSKFQVGDRIVRRDKLEERGTVEAILRSEPDDSGGIYMIDWDNGPSGPLGQGLIGPESETPT